MANCETPDRIFPDLHIFNAVGIETSFRSKTSSICSLKGSTIASCVRKTWIMVLIRAHAGPKVPRLTHFFAVMQASSCNSRCADARGVSPSFINPVGIPHTQVAWGCLHSLVRISFLSAVMAMMATAGFVSRTVYTLFFPSGRMTSSARNLTKRS